MLVYYRASCDDDSCE